MQKTGNDINWTLQLKKEVLNMFRVTIAALFFLAPHCANAINLEVTTIGKETKIVLINAKLVCDGKDLGSNIYIEQDGATSQIPFAAINFLRTLQNDNLGFFMKANSGAELRGNKMLCSNYQFTGENEFGGTTSVSGDKWRLVKIKG